MNMNTKSSTKKAFITMAFLLLTAGSLLTGCATTQQVASNDKFYFPALPDEPRIEYVASFQNESNINKPSALDKFFGTEEKGETLDSPINVASNSANVAYCVDINKSTVTVWDFAKSEVRRLNGGYESPRGITVDKAGNIYLTDKGAKLFIFNPAETQINEINLADHVKIPMQPSIDNERNRIIIPDASGHKIAVFDLTGNFLFEFGKRGGDPGEFNFPVATAVERSGNILVADSLNARVERFTPDGKFIETIGKRGDGFGDLQIVKGVSADSDGNIYVTDGRHNKLVIYTEKGEFAFMIGDTSRKKDGTDSTVYTGKSFIGKDGKAFIGAFQMPQGIFIDRNNSIFLADQMNHIYHKFQYLDDASRKKIMVDNKDLVDQLIAKFEKKMKTANNVGKEKEATKQ